MDESARSHPANAPTGAEVPHSAPASRFAPAGRQVVLGAGPVGRAVAARLIELGVRPDIVTRSGAVVDGSTALVADLSRPEEAVEALAGAATVYQCSQPRYHRWPQEFPALQEAVVAGAARAGALIVAVENVYGYGPVDGPYHEGLGLVATTHKGRVRVAMWRSLEEAHRSGRCRSVAARASDFYGPGVTGSTLGERFFGRLVSGRPAEVYGDPERLHSYTYVEDLAATMVRLAVEPNSWGRAWHVPNAPAVSTAEIVRIAADLAGVRPRHRVVGPLALRLGGLFVPEASEMVEMLYEFDHDHVVDDSAVRTLLVSGPGADATPLEVGLASTVQWYREHLAGGR